ncbi:Homeobox-leucine zipper protein ANTHOCYANINLESS 2 [Rhynchospora pubera]|uniref:Homeobox-leucine zipper protein ANTHOCYANINLESS 2 n=1 Tax=Rhynchospora pubera TaxID=906938 RepID=A0AAV8EE69_9POAL|nr:Homeobox-leucine zipper protein ANTHOCYANINLESS 2 [Rhynchospora pubera]
MNFGGMFDRGSGAIQFSGTPISQPVRLVSKPGFSSAGLSLGLQTNLETQADMSLMASYGGGNGSGGAGSGDGDSVGKNREEENESRSGSDNLDGASGDDLEQQNSRKKTRYHRHTPQQIQELENVFKECPHPDEKQRLELSRRLNLEVRQVKFWFQNRRTQMKTQLERHENTLLRQENDKLRAENLTMHEAMKNPICTNCGGPAMLGEVSLEEQHLRVENARLKDELGRVCTLAEKFLGRPMSSLASPILQLPCSSLELGMGTNNSFVGFGSSVAPTLPAIPDFISAGIPSQNIPDQMKHPYDVEGSLEKRILLEVALSAMEELIKVAHINDPIWVLSPDGGPHTLNFDEYNRVFPRVIGARQAGHVSEATRDVGKVIINSASLVETLMDAGRWRDMFPYMIARASTIDMISNGMGGTRNGTVQLMRADIQVLSPLVPVREVTFLRFCKQHAQGVWAVVDVSIDGIRGNSSSGPEYVACRRLPSGCIVQDTPDGCNITWVEHVEYDEAAIHQLYQPLVRSGLAFGARRWLATLQRQCQFLAILMSSVPTNPTVIAPIGQRSLLKLAQRMTENFCSSVCNTGMRKWERLPQGWETSNRDVRVLSRQATSDPGEPPGVVLLGATSVWLPVTPRRLFDYLCNERMRGNWDILCNGFMQEMHHISKGQHPGNGVSILRVGDNGGNHKDTLILQESCIDESGAMLVYTNIDCPTMHVVMDGGDSTYVALLPSGFVILPDGRPNNISVIGHPDENTNFNNNIDSNNMSGSLVTVAFQILSPTQTGKFDNESVNTVRNLLTCTIQKIQSALAPVHNTAP